MQPTQTVERLNHDLAALRFAAPVSCTYNPLQYASVPHSVYLQRFARSPREVMLVGMNPGPYGMVQTGIPFGAVPWVRDWMGIEAEVGTPEREHPKRPVLGFACPRTEVSGERLYGWAQAAFGTADRFFARFFVHNYCPLAFMEESGRNRTPDKLPRHERDALYAVCDVALQRMVAFMQPRWVVGIGGFAAARARVALADCTAQVGCMLHPSPASPLANRGWAARAEADLAALGISVTP